MHRVCLAGPTAPARSRARWVVDASGRASLLKRQLGLVRPSTHGANAAWWRVQLARERSTTGRAIRHGGRASPSGLRWQSTIHLMGAGYWVWLIPLGSGSHSFGIVADGDLHPFARINRFERAMDWLREFEPQCAEVMEAHASRARGFSRAAALRARVRAGRSRRTGGRWSAKRASSPIRSIRRAPISSRWATTTSTDLIVRDARGEDIAARAEAFNTTYLRLFDAFIRLYDGQYPIMGNAQVMTAKVSWDNACYWAITALLFFQRRLRQPEFMASIEPLMRRFFVLHARMQQFFRAWYRADAGSVYAAASPNVVDVEFLRRVAGRA